MAKDFQHRVDHASFIPSLIDATNFWEVMMAEPFAIVDEPFSMVIREAVSEAVKMLNAKDRFVIESVYIWGSSYSQLANELGYASKSSAHGAVKTAEQHLGDILLNNDEIRRMLNLE